MQLYEELRSHFYIPDAYTAWEVYRRHLTDRLIRMGSEEVISIDMLRSDLQAYAQERPTLAILGAGQMNDLDLAALRPYFSEITLVDQDQAAMQTARARYGLTTDPAIRIEQATFTGMGEPECALFCREMERYINERDAVISVPELDMHSIALLQEIQAGSGTPAWNPGQYDYVCCVGLHSQLNAMPAYIYRYMWNQLAASDRLELVWQDMKPEDSAWMAYLREQNATRIHSLHEQLFRSAKRGILIGCEAGRCDKPYAGLIENPEIPAWTESPIEGARQCMADLDRRSPDAHTFMLCWPFSEAAEIYYHMLFWEIHS